MQSKQRSEWVDVSKGILILLVVYAHSAAIQIYSDYHTLIYWFHMPAFFVLSGLFHKEVNNITDLKLWWSSRCKDQVKYYALFILSIYTYRSIFVTSDYLDMITELKNVVLGGRYIDGYYAPIWFITCLLFTQLLFNIVTLVSSRTWIRLVIIFLLFILAHIESKFFPQLKIPLNIDVSLFSLFFFSCGYYLKNHMNNLTLGLICVVGLLFTISNVKNGQFSYFLDLKQHSYHNTILDAIIPLFGTGTVFLISYLIGKEGLLFRLFSYLGRHSLNIMYLHLIMAIELKKIILYSGLPYFLIIGVISPIIIISILSNIKVFYINRLHALLYKNKYL
ncbi:acyltransferase family protein [Paenibacillus gansuensis]|uniref:Acyltransferase family protein n=1 Tax=Paenibacillus gansuensis TaxID=306542 RepID=A0ABW5PFI4_9BACL